MSMTEYSLSRRKAKKKSVNTIRPSLTMAVVLGLALIGDQNTPALAQAQETATRGTWACQMVLNSGKTAQQDLDELMIETAADPRLLPEQRLIILSGKVEFDSLCSVDARLVTREASYFEDQELARWHRIDAARTSPAAAAPWRCETVTESGKTAQQNMDVLLTKCADNPGLLPEMRAVTLAAKSEFDSLCLVDARLQTGEASVFIDQERDRWQHLSDAKPAKATAESESR